MVLGHAEKAGDDDDRERAAKAWSRSKAPSGKPSISAWQRAIDLGTERGDPARGEGAQDKAAEPGVTRRLELQHRMRFDRVERGEVRRDRRAVSSGRAAEAAVAQDRVTARWLVATGMP